NGQLNLCAGIEFAPDLQLSAYQFGAFIHARQAVMAGLSVSGQDRGIDSFSVVTDAQAKLALVIPDFHFNMPGVRMPEGIAQRFAGNAEDVVPQQRNNLAWRSFHAHAKVW